MCLLDGSSIVMSACHISQDHGQVRMASAVLQAPAGSAMVGVVQARNQCVHLLPVFWSSAACGRGCQSVRRMAQELQSILGTRIKTEPEAVLVGCDGWCRYGSQKREK